MIEYKQLTLKSLSSDSDGVLKELNEQGRDDWLLVSPLVGTGRGLTCIMSKRRQGRPPKMREECEKGENESNITI